MATPSNAAATPILSSGVLPPRRPRKRVLGTIIGFCIGVAFVIAVHNVSGRSDEPSLLLFDWFGGLALAVTVHECGHLLAGWLVGFYFNGISLGPFLLGLEYGRLRLQVRLNFAALGYARMQIETVRRLRRNLLLYISAGPAANLITGGAATIFAVNASGSRQGSHELAFLSGFALLSLILGIVNLIPFGKALRSDGARIRMLLKSREQTRRWLSFVALSSLQRKGIRPKQWKRTWLNAVSAIRDETVDEISGNLLAYTAASDQKDDQTAADRLERLLELSAVALPITRDFIAREASFFCAWWCKDPELAHKWSGQAKSSKHQTSLMGIRFAVAVSVARGEFDAAMAKWNKGLDFIKRLPETPAKKLLQESWREWEDEIRERRTQETLSGAKDLQVTTP